MEIDEIVVLGSDKRLRTINNPNQQFFSNFALNYNPSNPYQINNDKTDSKCKKPSNSSSIPNNFSNSLNKEENYLNTNNVNEKALKGNNSFINFNNEITFNKPKTWDKVAALINDKKSVLSTPANHLSSFKLVLNNQNQNCKYDKFEQNSSRVNSNVLINSNNYFNESTSLESNDITREDSIRYGLDSSNIKQNINPFLSKSNNSFNLFNSFSNINSTSFLSKSNIKSNINNESRNLDLIKEYSNSNYWSNNNQICETSSTNYDYDSNNKFKASSDNFNDEFDVKSTDDHDFVNDDFSIRILLTHPSLKSKREKLKRSVLKL
jgi:hypothetical protein